MMSDNYEVQIKTIEAHLRRLGLTEEQILLHLTPLRLKAGKPQPIKRKAESRGPGLGSWCGEAHGIDCGFERDGHPG
jgi:hypothetical protein